MLNAYDYESAVMEDAKTAINEGYVDEKIMKDIVAAESIEDKGQILYDALMSADIVTGSGSGSYTCNRYQASENLNGNWHLISALTDYYSAEDLGEAIKEPEYIDVLIREMLLSVICLEDDKSFQELYYWIQRTLEEASA